MRASEASLYVVCHSLGSVASEAQAFAPRFTGLAPSTLSATFRVVPLDTVTGSLRSLRFCTRMRSVSRTIDT
ncbi:hypothetical protein CQ040_14885 [Microbacterium sp. MYb54]|nr:hypothetical protein CQ032_19310 [Microbacterium sp. MYb43]PRB19691.1 hypothetical protein CQ040_14885 [Microbacterium sp. MYb54]PRB23379.1 hypothetical protein CQ037_17970 [Microbacterium sp. MYb50]PRB61611.1 hypothetical protein CQ021_18150 [Microbacterium sp. MYb24]PRB70583.1 hypothetical protein CQ027_16655 [Microbacterium sp. MYb32]